METSSTDFNDFSGSPVGTHRAAHMASDVDTERYAQHHTLGNSPNQAAPGNHTHIGSVILYNVTLPPNTVALNGATLNYASYPEFFRFLGLGVGSTYVLPNIAKMAVRVK